ncbi:MAG: hypothetical protein COB24_07425 [Hyphomicrobiales bacterium]|nr:MAG: hypothetical protein COB24_07425 [Hyphomicrobiales bacterium]
MSESAALFHKLKTPKLFIFLDQMIVSGSNFAISVLLARSLGLDNFGQYSLLWLVVLFSSSIQSAMIISPILTFVGKKNLTIIDQYLSVMMVLQIALAVLTALVVFLFFEFIPLFNKDWEIGDLALYASLFIMSFLIQDFYRRVLIVKNRYIQLIMVDLVAYIGSLLYIAFANPNDLKFIFSVLFVFYCLSFILAQFGIKRTSTSWKYKVLIFKKNWHFSQWLLYSAILQWGSGNAYTLALGVYLGNWAIGVIRILQNLMGIFHIVFIALENILPTTFAQQYKSSGLTGMMRIFKQQIQYAAIFFLLFGLVIYFQAGHIIEFIYGSEYQAYANLLIWYVVIYFFIYLSMLQRYILRATEKTKVIFISYIATAAFGLSTSQYFVSNYEFKGAIIGMLILQVIIVAIFYVTIKQKEQMKSS